MTSLYRKWRSNSFDDLVGQEHVVRTLRNAVRQGRVAHAYLFTGPRGTGKTSTARILARAVNCLDPRDGNPCNRCDACVAAQAGRALDVIEIDAASNTSVDNVRELRERVAYAAGEGGHKIYIVDEVHRLSGAAFDAFLKTLEEPPPHVIFVFASTEPHKVPATIASRCQRFDFRRISPAATLTRLQTVAREEGIPATDGALAVIAQNAHGSLRDALGLLDQASTYGDDRITEDHIRKALGLADPTLVARLTDHLISSETGLGLQEAAAFVDAGGDPPQLAVQLATYWRALLLTVTGAGATDAGLDPGLEGSLARHAEYLDQRRIIAVLRALTDSDFSPKYDLVPSLPFELGYVQAALALRSSPGQGAHPVPRQTQPPPAPPSSPPGEPSPTPESSPRPAEGAPAATATTSTGEGTPDMNGVWRIIRERMRPKNRSLEALLKDAYLMKVEGGEVTIGFLYDFHTAQFGEVQKRRILEEVVSDVLGSAYRVKCIKASKAEIEAVRGAGVVPEDDGFVEEAAERLRQYHARQISNGNS